MARALDLYCVALAVTLALAGSVACDPPSSSAPASTRSAAPDASGAAPTAARPLAPLTGEPTAPLELPGQAASQPVVALAPLGATTARPIALVLTDPPDGAGPAPLCEQLFQHLERAAFVVCWMGSPVDARAGLRGSFKALKLRYGAWVAPSPVMLLAGPRHVEAAIPLIREEPSFFARVALLGLPAGAWSSTTAHVFAKSGGQRLLVTAEGGEVAEARHAALMTHRAGAPAQAHEAPRDQMPWTALGWLLEGDPRFLGPPGGAPHP